eukprot:6467593-Amphidinium_carterae.1
MLAREKKVWKQLGSNPEGGASKASAKPKAKAKGKSTTSTAARQASAGICTLCKASPEDCCCQPRKLDKAMFCHVCFHHKNASEVSTVVSFDMLEDSKWALYAETANEEGEVVAMGDKCDSCWRAWKASFGALTWECLLELAASSDKVREVLDSTKARQQANMNAMPGPSVHLKQGVQIQVSRKFLCATEKDLRQALGKARLTKATTKGLSSLKIPNEMGEQPELVYLFDHPDMGSSRELTLSAVVQVDSDNAFLKPDSKWSKDHDNWAFEYLVKSEGEMMGQTVGTSENIALFVFINPQGCQGLNMKEVSVPKFDSWLKTVQQGDEEVDEGTPLQTPGVAEQHVKLSGAAAECAQSDRMMLKRGNTGDLEHPTTPLPKIMRTSPEGQSTTDWTSIAGAEMEVDAEDG